MGKNKKKQSKTIDQERSETKAKKPMTSAWLNRICFLLLSSKLSWDTFGLTIEFDWGQELGFRIIITKWYFSDYTRNDTCSMFCRLYLYSWIKSLKNTIDSNLKHITTKIIATLKCTSSNQLPTSIIQTSVASLQFSKLKNVQH